MSELSQMTDSLRSSKASMENIEKLALHVIFILIAKPRNFYDFLTLSLLLDGSSEMNYSRLQSPFYPLLCLGVLKQLEGVTESIKTPVFTIQDNTAR